MPSAQVQLWELYLLTKASRDAWASSASSKTYECARVLGLELIHAYSLLSDRRVPEALRTLQKIEPEHLRLCFRSPHLPPRPVAELVREMEMLREELCVL